MSDSPVRGTKRDTTANTAINAQAAFVESIVRDMVNTAEITSINTADAQATTSTGGRAKATPLVAQTDGFNNSLSPAMISGMPFYRPQAGKAAILMRPQPGDMALAIFTKRDSSGVDVGTTKATPPGSFRSFNQADGFLLNGFLGPEPEIWLSLDPESGDIELSTKAAKIDITCRESGDILISTAAGTFTIEATTSDNLIDAPRVTFSGDVIIRGNLTVEGHSTGAGGGPAVFSNGIVNQANGFTNAGGITNTGAATTSNGITVETHTHPTPAGESSSPSAGT